MEKRIPCPHCGSLSQCIEDEQKEYSSYMCFSCGFMSDSRFVKGYTENLKSQPALLNKLKFFDKMRKIYWYPTIINMGPMGLIYPEGTEEDWHWRFAKVVGVEKGQEDKYGGHTSRLDIEGAKTYNSDEFLKACIDMGITKEIKDEG